MNDLIIQALNDAIIVLERRVPQTKKEGVYVNIDDVSPLDITKFMTENNIPNDAHFAGKPNGYDSFDQICLYYEIDVPTTKLEKVEFKRRVFSSIAFKKVYDILILNEYKRKGCDSSLFADYKDTTVYDMYITKDFDRLVKYYSLFFVL
jgi:hypothetical protein